MAGLIKYVRGDVLRPLDRSHQHVVIPHVCNDQGGWGKGFTVNLSRLWPEPERTYRSIAATGLLLGTVQLCPTPGHRWLQHRQDITVVNMVAQRGYGAALPRIGAAAVVPPLRYGALVDCMRAVGSFAVAHGAVIHSPWFGCDLAGGHRETVNHLVRELWASWGLEVWMYDFEPDPRKHGVILGSEPVAA